MNVDLGIWGKLTRVVFFLLVLAGMMGVAVWYLPVIRQNERMRKEILRLDEKLEREKQDYRELKSATEVLQRDPKAVERLARERLGYARPDEFVVRFEKADTNSPVLPPNP
jgi:cell division protein DivIC